MIEQLVARNQRIVAEKGSAPWLRTEKGQTAENEALTSGYRLFIGRRVN